MNRKQKKMLLRIIISALLTAVFIFLPIKGLWQIAAFLVPYLIIGYDILKKAVKGILSGRPFDENFLMAVATVGAIVLGEYIEAAAVMLLYQTGELFQSYAVGKSRRSIGALMDIRPDFARVCAEGGGETECDPETVAVGTLIAVFPGERVPIDGVIESGESTLDTAALTGESVPRKVGAGDTVASGCINGGGVLRIRTTRPFGESTAMKILELVENASSRKSRSEEFITKFARIYTPAVCIGAIALAVLPPLATMIFTDRPAEWITWIYRALTSLVISCPCALVISIPLSFFAGLGGASRAGVLIKGSNYMETLSRVDTVVFDKTGTLTQGIFDVVGVHHCPIGEEKLIEYAALAESCSSHPIGASLRRAYGGELSCDRAQDIREIRGKGITATVDGKRIAVGNGKLMEAEGVTHTACTHSGTVVHVAVDGEYMGHILISDRIKSDSSEAVTRLKKIGVRRIVMLTGDRAESADVAGKLGITEVKCELLPQDKVSEVEALLSEQRGGRLAFVGDGVNDAPVLARADIGVAMGALGSDAAIEAADVVLMDDSPLKLAHAIAIARRCMRIVRENIWIAIGIKLICLALGALGLASMWLAIFADVGVMVLAVLNAIRALRTGKI